jgi:hypothetical protein
MNAVTFMDAMKKPSAAAAAPPSKPKQRRMSPNAALIAGVGTLLLAMGVGVLIGHSGDHSTASAPATPQVITLHGGGEAESATGSKTNKATIGGGTSKAKGKKQSTASLKKEAETQAGAEEVLKPSGNVKLPPATVKPGSKCPSGTTGCKGGEFTGEFFGE